MNDMLEIQLAAPAVRDRIPKDVPLTERVSFAMRDVLAHERDLFWMTAHASDDTKLRTALAAVMLAGSEEDRGVIARSMQPLRMLSAAAIGIPVDWSAMEVTDDLVPIMKLWSDAKTGANDGAKRAAEGGPLE